MKSILPSLIITISNADNPDSHKDSHHRRHHHQDFDTFLMQEGLKLRGSSRRLGQSRRSLYYTDSGNAYTYEVGLYIEVDQILVTNTGSVTNMLDYLAELIAGINIMYEKEVDTHLTIVEVVITNRYDSASGTSNALDIQRNALKDTNWPNSEADLVHAILGRSLGGGIAYLGVLCNKGYGFGVSAGINGDTISVCLRRWFGILWWLLMVSLSTVSPCFRAFITNLFLILSQN